jgi:dTDP-glucose 4,6-dehydratase
MGGLIREDGLTVARAWLADGLDAAELDGAVVAVSGASGLLGRHIVAVLLGLAETYSLDTRVTAVGRDEGRLRGAFAEWDEDGRLAFHAADVSRPGGWPEGATHLIHAASPATPKLFAENPVGVIDANIVGTRSALDAAATEAYVCFISTMEIYGAIPRPEGEDVEVAEATLGLVDPMDIRSAYPESKRLAETLVVAHARQFGTSADIVRVSHTYGPGTSPDDNRVQVEFVKKAVAGETIVLKSDGKLRRHYTYAADSASAVVRVLATRRLRSAPEAFNVADNNSRISIRDLAELALVAAGRKPDELVIDIPPDSGQLWSKMPGGTFLDTSRVEALGWRPVFDLPTGLRRMAGYLAGADPEGARS